MVLLEGIMVTKMRPRVLDFSIAIATIAIFIFILPVALKVYAQDKPKRETLQATAMGQTTAAGKKYSDCLARFVRCRGAHESNRPLG